MLLVRSTRPKLHDVFIAYEIGRRPYSVRNDETSPSFGRWPAAYKQISECSTALSIFPNYPGLQQQHHLSAFFGDKFLGAAAAKVLSEDYPIVYTTKLEETEVPGMEENNWPLEKGSATKLVSEALSNKFLHRHASLIIPNHFNSIQEQTDRTIGSSVEVAVYLVTKTLTLPDSDGAIKDLARYLLSRAMEEEKSPSNAKGTLLELGATLETTQHARWLPERPLFESVAVCGEHRAVATGKSKKQAEQLAAEKVLARVQPVSHKRRRATFPAELANDPTDVIFQTLADDAKTKATNKAQQWTSFVLPSNDFYLREGEDVCEWWHRGASNSKEAFRRALLSQHVFPNEIQSTSSWSCRWNGHYLVMIALDCNGSFHSFLGSSSESLTKARASAGMEATAYLKSAVISSNWS